MAVCVDPLQTYHPKQVQPSARRHGRRWSHLTADTVDELHAFARRIGMRPEWFQARPFPHYDLLPRRRLAAVRAGAVEVTTREMVRRWREGERQVPDERHAEEAE